MSAQRAFPNASGPTFGLEAWIQLSRVVKKRQNRKTRHGSGGNVRLGGLDEPPANGWKGNDRLETGGDIGKMMDETMEITVVELPPWN
jgi:hypothetical protein